MCIWDYTEIWYDGWPKHLSHIFSCLLLNMTAFYEPSFSEDILLSTIFFLTDIKRNEIRPTLFITFFLELQLFSLSPSNKTFLSSSFYIHSLPCSWCQCKYHQEYNKPIRELLTSEFPLTSTYHQYSKTIEESMWNISSHIDCPIRYAEEGTNVCFLFLRIDVKHQHMFDKQPPEGVSGEMRGINY